MTAEDRQGIAEEVGQLKSLWEACGPWVPDDSLTPFAQAVKRQFEAMLADPRVTEWQAERERLAAARLATLGELTALDQELGLMEDKPQQE